MQIIQGTPDARRVQYRRECNFFVLNYELVLRDLSVINETLSPDLIILDEAQRIKNWRTKIASAIKMIPSRYAFVLSGTPLENRLEDLYSLMQVVDPHVLGPLWRYFVSFHVTDEHDKVLGYRNLSELRRRLAPVMLRRDRSLVSKQLPRRIDQRLDVALTNEQRELHDSAMHSAGVLAQIAKRRPLTPSESNRLMSSLQLARMACNAAGLVDKETVGSPKLDELENIVDELCIQSGLKIVVFSQWKLMTFMVEERLKRMKVGYVHLHGGVPTAKRGALIDRFDTDDAVQVFIATDAGGTGLNLQKGAAVVNLDIPWNPAVLEQRIARVHRLGQTRSVQSILIISIDSYEEHVMSLVQGKQHLFNNVIDPDATGDVVGVSKKLLESLIDDLADSSEADKAASGKNADAAPVDDELLPEAVIDVETSDQAAVDTQIEAGLQHCIEQIQQQFGSRIERILGSGGGLLIVLDQVESTDDRATLELSTEQIQIAAIDPRTLSNLQRLGSGSPIQETTTYFDAAQTDATTKATPYLIRKSQENLQAAEILLTQHCAPAAKDLLLSATLNAAGARADQEQAPTIEEAGIWIYAEALPNGWLDQEQANLVTRSIALAQAQSVPEELLHELMQDVSDFVDSVST